MSRIQKLHENINTIFARVDEIPPVYKHLCGVSQLCVLLAVKRGENPELSAFSGMLHDIAYLASCDTVKYENEPHKIQGITGENHAERSALLADKILAELGVTSETENEIIITAIRNHANKERIDGPIDEILKDADVFEHGLLSVSMQKTNFRGDRWDRVCREIGMDNCRKN